MPNQNEYIDIPMSMEDTPLHLIQRVQSYSFAADRIDLAYDFLCRIESALKLPEAHAQIYGLYFNYFEVANSSRFAVENWPASFEIENKYEEKDFDPKATVFYNELILRNNFQKMKDSVDLDAFLDVAQHCEEAYQDIFTYYTDNINFPAAVVWTIVDNFLLEMQQYQVRAQTIPKEKLTPIFTIQTWKATFNKLVSSIRESKTETSLIFGYYSLIGIASIELFMGNYSGALGVLSRISLEETLHYSKSLNCLLQLFTVGSFSYFMQEQYKESARLCQFFLMFCQKNKKHLINFNTEHYDRITGVLLLSYIFLEEQPKASIMEVFKNVSLRKERMSDIYLKLKQNDAAAFTRLFEFCAPPSLHPVPSSLEKFTSLQAITLNTILQHYTQISVCKIAHMLKKTEVEVREALSGFSSVSEGKGAWQITIMNPLLSQMRNIHVQILDDVVQLDVEDNQGLNQWEQYKQEVAWLVGKVDAL